jgi:hypothetical protein
MSDCRRCVFASFVAASGRTATESHKAKPMPPWFKVGWRVATIFN